MLLRVLKAALDSPLSSVVVVLGHKASMMGELLEPFLIEPRLRAVFNSDYKEGMASSIRAGVREIKDEFPSCMLLFADQPLLDSNTISFLLEAFFSSGKEICVPLARGVRSHPVLFGSRFYPELLALKGDIGGREILQAHPDEVLAVEVPDADRLMDVDSFQDLSRVKRILKRVENKVTKPKAGKPKPSAGLN